MLIKLLINTIHVADRSVTENLKKNPMIAPNKKKCLLREIIGNFISMLVPIIDLFEPILTSPKRGKRNV